MEVRKVDPRQVAAYRRQRKVITSSPGRKKAVDEKPLLEDKKPELVDEKPQSVDDEKLQLVDEKPKSVDGVSSVDRKESDEMIVMIPASATKQKKIRVASYSRVSSLLESQKTSIENQEMHFSTLITSHPDWTFIGSYIDDGITGTKADIRPELQRLLNDCKSGKIDLILTKSISRFSRNTKDCLEMVRELNSLGVHIWFEKENIHTDSMESEFMLSLLSTFAEDESKSISGNMKWGIRKRFEAGTYKQSRIPYGYDKDWEVNPTESRVISRIFSLACDGKGCNQIAQILNKEKIPGPTGQRWEQRTLMLILTNPVYIGDTLYQRTYRNDEYRQVKNMGQLDQYYDEGHHEPIVSKEIFETAQKMIAQRGKAVGTPSKKKPEHYCFTGILICKNCGSILHRQARDDNSIWICHKHWNDPKECPMKPVGDADLKAAFINCLNKLAWSQRRPDGILDVYERLLGKSEEEKNAERLQEIEDLLSENRREMRKLTAIIMRERFLPEHRERRLFLTNQEKTLIREKNEILIAGAPVGTLQQLKKFTREWIITDDLEAFPEDVFTEFVESVDVDSGKFAYFKFKCGLLLIESIERTQH